MAKSFLKMPNFWASITKLCFGIICFGLYFYYYEVIYVICRPTVETDSETFPRECNTRVQLVETACVGFTFVIEPLIIVAYIASAEHFERTPLIQLFSLAGSVAYFVSGCILIHQTNNTTLSLQTPLRCIQNSRFDHPDFPWNDQPANLLVYNVIGALFITTGLIYFAHFVCTMYIGIKSRHGRS